MARDAKLFVRIADDRTAEQLARAGYSAAADGEWLHIFAGELSDGEVARELSMTLATTTIAWQIDSSAQQLSLVCFHYGVQVRELCYDAGWRTQGRAQPFEGKALAAWLAKPALRVSPDGYDVPRAAQPRGPG